MIDESEQSVGLTYAGKQRTYGIRFSAFDGLALAAAFAIAIATWSISAGFSLLVLFVVLHFFLFCNIFRIRRKPELIWAGTFIVNCCCWIVAGRLALWPIAVCQLFVTVVILLNELRLPSYHGLFARSINPRLNDCLADRLKG